MIGECDCCGASPRRLTQCWAPGGLETWACEACRGCDPCEGVDPGDYDDGPDPELEDAA